MPVRTPVRIRNPREALEKQHLMGRLHRIEREGAHDDGDDVAGPSTKPKAVGTTDMDEFTSIFARAMAESDSSPEPASPSSPDEPEPHDPGSMLADLALVDAVWERRSMIPERRDARGSGGDARPFSSAADTTAAVESYTAYFGAYSIDTEDGYVVNQVLGSLNPRGAGGDTQPFYEFVENELVLTPSLQCPDSFLTDRGCGYGTTGIQLRNVWEKVESTTAGDMTSLNNFPSILSLFG